MRASASAFLLILVPRWSALPEDVDQKPRAIIARYSLQTPSNAALIVSLRKL